MVCLTYLQANRQKKKNVACLPFFHFPDLRFETDTSKMYPIASLPRRSRLPPPFLMSRRYVWLLAESEHILRWACMQIYPYNTDLSTFHNKLAVLSVSWKKNPRNIRHPRIPLASSLLRFIIPQKSRVCHGDNMPRINEIRSNAGLGQIGPQK